MGESDAPTASAGSSTPASVKSSMLQTVQLNPNSVMKLGRVITPAKRIIDLDLESFIMKDITWSEPKFMKFLLTIEKT